MADYPPPNQNVLVFNPAEFRTNDIPLTIAEAENYFLAFPNAQGTENLTSANVSSKITITNSSTNQGLGYQALENVSSGYNNTAIGNQALKAATTAYSSTALGFQAGKSIVTSTGHSNTCIGNLAGTLITNKSQSVLIGSLSGSGANIGNNNVGVGWNTLAVSTGGSNSAVGSGAGQAITSGQANCCFGNSSGTSITAGDYNTCVGMSADVTGVSTQYCSVIGCAATSSVSNSITLGRVDTDTVRLNTITPLYATLPTALTDVANTTVSPTVLCGNKYYIIGSSMTIATATASTLFTFSNIGIGVFLFTANIILTGASTSATVNLVVDGTTRGRSFPTTSASSGCPGTLSYVYSNSTAGGTISLAMSSTNHTFTSVQTSSTATLIRIA
jgi:hypothetical protein